MLLKRIGIDVVWIAIMLAVGYAVSWLFDSVRQTSMLASIFAWVLPVAVGVLIGERRWALTWFVSVFRAARIMREQDDNPEGNVVLYIARAELFPDRPKGAENVDYVAVSLAWDNRTYQQASVADIRGTLSIDGSRPEANLPSSVGSEVLGPWQKTLNPQTILVVIAGDALKIVRDIRAKGYGKANLLLRISATVNKKSVEYDPVSYTAYLV